MKLCMKGKFVHIKNMSKEQLCRVSVSDFWDVFSGPKSLRGFRETGPWVTEAERGPLSLPQSLPTPSRLWYPG